MHLKGEVALVTGASGNIGAGIAERLAEAGATVVAHYHRDEDGAARLAERIGARTMAADLSDASAVEQLVEAAGPTLLVNNAARQDVAALADLDLANWQGVIDTNLTGAFLLTQCCAEAWSTRSEGGAIVNIASIEGSEPATGHAHYATSKAGLIMFTRAAALEYGPAGIRVNAVSPGLIERDGIESDWPEGVERWRSKAPLGCLGSPQDVAEAVLFLLSPAARWISGTNLVVDGGMSAQNRW